MAELLDMKSLCQSRIELLPDEILVQIISHMDPAGLRVFHLVSKRFYNLMKDESCWRLAVERHFGALPLRRISKSWRIEYLYRVRYLRDWKGGRCSTLQFEPRIGVLHQIYVDLEANKLLGANLDRGMVAITDPSTGKVAKDKLYASPDHVHLLVSKMCIQASRIAVGKVNGSISVLHHFKDKIASCKYHQLPPLSSHDGPVTDLIWAPPTSHILLTSGRDGDVRIWDTHKSKLVGLLAGDQTPLTSLQCEPRLAVVAGRSDGRLAVWNVDVLSLYHQQQSHSSSNAERNLLGSIRQTNTIGTLARIIDIPAMLGSNTPSPVKILELDLASCTALVALESGGALAHVDVRNGRLLHILAKPQAGTITAVHWIRTDSRDGPFNFFFRQSSANLKSRPTSHSTRRSSVQQLASTCANVKGTNLELSSSDGASTDSSPSLPPVNANAPAKKELSPKKSANIVISASSQSPNSQEDRLAGRSNSLLSMLSSSATSCSSLSSASMFSTSFSDPDNMLSSSPFDRRLGAEGQQKPDQGVRGVRSAVNASDAGMLLPASPPHYPYASRQKAMSLSLSPPAAQSVTLVGPWEVIAGDSSGNVFQWHLPLWQSTTSETESSESKSMAGKSTENVHTTLQPLRTVEQIASGRIAAVRIDACKVVVMSSEGQIRVLDAINLSVVRLLRLKLLRHAQQQAGLEVGNAVNALPDQQNTLDARLLYCNEYQMVATIAGQIKAWDFRSSASAPHTASAALGYGLNNKGRKKKTAASQYASARQRKTKRLSSVVSHTISPKQTFMQDLRDELWDLELEMEEEEAYRRLQDKYQGKLTRSAQNSTGARKPSIAGAGQSTSWNENLIMEYAMFLSKEEQQSSHSLKLESRGGIRGTSALSAQVNLAKEDNFANPAVNLEPGDLSTRGDLPPVQSPHATIGSFEDLRVDSFKAESDPLAPSVYPQALDPSGDEQYFNDDYDEMFEFSPSTRRYYSSNYGGVGHGGSSNHSQKIRIASRLDIEAGGSTASGKHSSQRNGRLSEYVTDLGENEELQYVLELSRTEK